MFLLAGGGAAWLQHRGPPGEAAHPSGEHAEAHAPAPHEAEHKPAAAEGHGAPAHDPAPAPHTESHAAPPATPPGTIAQPDPALLEPDPDAPGARLPRIGPGGRMPATAYARPAPPPDGRPRVALLLAGFGMNAADSRTSLAGLPQPVDLGVSPYAGDLAPLLAELRSSGHEYLVTLPMESQGYPLNDSGRHALLTGAAVEDNTRNLHWALGRVPGATGATGASDGLRGERFAAAAAQMGAVRQELAARGLFFVDPRPASPLPTLVLDDPATRAELDRSLAALEQRARDENRALGISLGVHPALVERLAAWARGLDGRGITLVPVSALVPVGAGSPQRSPP